MGPSRHDATLFLYEKREFGAPSCGIATTSPSSALAVDMCAHSGASPLALAHAQRLGGEIQEKGLGNALGIT